MLYQLCILLLLLSTVALLFYIAMLLAVLLENIRNEGLL